MTGFIHAVTWLAGLIRATIKALPRISFWEWADKNVVVPEESGGPYPGQLQTRRFPVFRGLFDLSQRRGVHFVTLCASARVGKTLFSICILLYWLAERVGHVAWLDPSAQSAKKFVRSELEHFLRLCPAVWRLAITAPKTVWSTFWKTFRGKLLRIIASGAEADMHGFNVELAIINEMDRCRVSANQDDASSPDKIIARTRLFRHTRLIIKNSTPGVAGEFSPIWTDFLRGSQHYPYVPCPHCSEAKRKRLRLKGEPEISRCAEATGSRKKKTSSPEGATHPPIGWSAQSMLEPWLAGWQRLTFSPEKKAVPFDANLAPLVDAKGIPVSRDKWRDEVTGQIRFEQFATYGERTNPNDATKKERVKTGYDVEVAERGATYQCAHCKKDIPHVKLGWMLARYRWVAHNPGAPADRISAHIWAAYSPFESWGALAKEFIEAGRNIEALIKIHNFSWGVPFVRQGTAIKESDLDRVIARTPKRYVKGEIPLRPEKLTMTVDKQAGEFWYSIRAWGIAWDVEGWPTWSALIDWGRAHSWDEILELAGIKPDQSGELRRFHYTMPDGEVLEYGVSAGLVDSGFEPESVYEFCLRQTTFFDPYKGASDRHTRGNPIRITKVLNEELDLWLCWSDFFASNLYYDCIKWGTAFGRAILWWLPTDIDDDYRKQLTDEYKGDDGWTARTKNNHLGDTEKMHRVFSDGIEEGFDELREERFEQLAKDRKKAA